jgi:hypothetical protein
MRKPKTSYFTEYGESVVGPTPWSRRRVNKFFADRRRAGREIDPNTAEVDWAYAQTLDPYGIYTFLPEDMKYGPGPDLPDELYCVGREYFARARGSDVWVWFGDLPEATAEALSEKHGHRLCSFVVQDGRVKWNIP